MDTPLSPQQLERYAPHILLREVGGEGQQRLLNARVLLVGVGGLGAPAAFYLAAAGVGRIGLADPDHVSLSNLQRQILYATSDINTPKTAAAQRALHRLNPDIKIATHPCRLTADNAETILSDYDIILDGSDNFATRFLLNDACYFMRKPLVSAAVGPLSGQLATFRAYEKDEDGNPNPSYRCLVPETGEEALPCEREGILGG